MEFRRLDSTRDLLFAEAFALYEISFPKHEQRLFKKQAALLENPLYHFAVIVDDGAFVGILLYWEGSCYTYIEHFAIDPAMRGREFGSKSLREFCRNNSFVILEIDPPVDSIAVRRQNFYQKLGFQVNDYAHAHPAYQKQFMPHELVVMSWPKHMTEREYQVFRRELAEMVMQDAAFDS